jgi:hypothetical protein
MPDIDPSPVAFMTGGSLYVEEINLTQMLPICINPTPVFPVRALFLHPGLSLIRPSPTHMLTIHLKPSNTRHRRPTSFRVSYLIHPRPPLLDARLPMTASRSEKSQGAARQV